MRNPGLGSLLLVVASPLVAVIAILIKLDSPGPVFFKQTRFGFNNQPIRALKFRTMHVNRGDPSGAQRTVRASPARKPVKLFLRRRQLLDSGHDQAYVWVVGAAGAAWITATADNGLVGFQKAAQRPGRSSLSPCRRFGGCAPFSGMAGTRLSYGRTIGSRDPRLQVAADRCGLLIVSPCDSIARSDELRLEM